MDVSRVSELCMQKANYRFICSMCNIHEILFLFYQESLFFQQHVGDCA